jgi:hypothetical protein
VHPLLSGFVLKFAAQKIHNINPCKYWQCGQIMSSREVQPNELGAKNKM